MEQSSVDPIPVPPPTHLPTPSFHLHLAPQRTHHHLAVTWQWCILLLLVLGPVLALPTLESAVNVLTLWPPGALPLLQVASVLKCALWHPVPVLELSTDAGNEQDWALNEQTIVNGVSAMVHLLQLCFAPRCAPGTARTDFAIMFRFSLPYSVPKLPGQIVCWGC